jgi:thiamine-monophosphate kinase
MMVEGVHFDLSWTTPFQLGFKLVSVNVSDIFAMGGKPEYLLLNFSAGKEAALDFFDGFFDGIEAAMKKYKISLIGGDISASEKVVLSATVLGYAGKYLSRKGARPGDRIYVTGHIGDAACGLRLMKTLRKKVAIELGKKQKFPLPWEVVAPLIRRHLMPEAREPHRFNKAATAMIDISDGLMLDLSRLATKAG